MTRVRPRFNVMLCAVLGGLVLISSVSADELGWTLTGTWSISDVWSVAYNPYDQRPYAIERTSSGGAHVLNPDGTSPLVVSADRAGGLAFDPDDGDMFIAEDYDGVIKRAAYGETTASVWVTTFDSGDDDVAGLAIIPSTYTGGVVAPGSALATDRGSGSADEIWAWSPDTSDGETELINDFTGLDDPFDIAVNDSRIIIVDGGTTGQLFELEKDNSTWTLSEITTTTPLAAAEAAVFDPLTGDLFCRSGPCRTVRWSVSIWLPVRSPRSFPESMLRAGVRLPLRPTARSSTSVPTVQARSTSTPCPEPTTLSLMALSCAALLRRRGR